MINILVCIPTYNEYVHSKLMLDILSLNIYNVKFTISFKTGSLIPRIRNHFISDFIENENFTHLLFIDSDLYDIKDTLQKMIFSHKDFIGGVYRKKTKFESYNINLLNDIDLTLKSDYPEVKHIASGLMLISREVINLLVKNYPEKVYFENGKKRYDFFFCGIVDGNYLSEDYGFCNLYREIGGKIYIVLNSEITHQGIMNYKGNFKNYLQYIYNEVDKINNNKQ